MSDADRVNLSFVEEVTFGVTPSANMIRLRFTNESLNMETDTVQSAEITSDRQVKDLIRTNVRGVGDINVEMSYDVLDAFLKAALFSTNWTSQVDITTTVTPTVSGNKFVGSGTPWGTFSAGQWISVSGCVQAANNGVFKIESISGTDLVVSGGILAAESTLSVKFQMGSQITNGTTLDTFTLERHYADLTNEYEVFIGMAIDQLSMNIAVNAIITAVCSMVGKSSSSASSSAGNGSYTAAPTNDVMNTIDHVAKFIEGDGSNVAADITSFTMQVANNLRTRLVVGTLGAASIGAGKFSPTGTLQKYFETATLMDKYLNQTATGLAVVLTVGTSEAYVFEFPSVKFSSGQRVAGGENTDIIADLAWTAYKHASEAITMRVAKWSDITP